MDLDTIKLLYTCDSDEERNRIANEIITKYNIRLEPHHILTAVTKLLDHIKNNHYSFHVDKYSFVLYNTLITNSNMFTALVLAMNENFITNGGPNLLIVRDKSCKYQSVGLARGVTTEPGIYYHLLEYYDFDVSALDIVREQKLKIIEYRNKKYSGKSIKAALVV
jgi:hypothetical protein